MRAEREAGTGGRGARLAALALTLLAGGCAGRPVVVQGAGAARARPAAPGAQAFPWFVVASDDNARAAATLAALLARHPELGFRVLAVGNDGLGVARGPYKFMLQPQMRGPGQPNKLVVKQLYAVKDTFREHGDRLRALCTDLDSTMHFLRTHVETTATGHLFVAQSELAFADFLPLDVLGAYLDDLKRATLSMGGARMAEYLE